MPESKARKEAVAKKRARQEAARRGAAESGDGKGGVRVRETKKLPAQSRNWVPWVFVPVGLLGVIWLVVYYLAGYQIGFMRAMGDWNILIGIGLMAASFVIATFWK